MEIFLLLLLVIILLFLVAIAASTSQIALSAKKIENMLLMIASLEVNPEATTRSTGIDRALESLSDQATRQTKSMNDRSNYFLKEARRMLAG